MRDSHGARLLFLVSSDYGELSNALYFVKDQAFADRALLLLPPRLFAANKEMLPAAAREYSSLDDIVSAVSAWEPDIVFLFSGYLHIFDPPFSSESLETLVRFLRGRGCRLVTSDPFLGALSDPHTSAELVDINPPLRRAFELLKSTVHFYPVACRDISAAIDQISVWNRAFERAAPDALHATARPVWSFVLSAEDYRIQVARHGAASFASHAIRLLESAPAQERDAVFIGPPECVASIRARMPEAPGIRLLSFCRHDLFTALVLQAEYAFYWNMFSNSLLVRLGNAQPAFFFDIGHLGKLYRLAVRNYFLGWRPVCLDQRRELSRPVLELLHTLYRDKLQGAQDHCRISPSPEEAIALLLEEVEHA